MLSWVKSKSQASNAKGVEVPAKLVSVFREVNSLEDCEDIFLATGFLESSALSEEKLDTIAHLINQLRADGLGLEPNLVGRAAASLFELDFVRGRASALLGNSDTDFISLSRDADAARDAGRFDSAQYLYWRSLELFPYHPAVQTQYGHSLKEQGLFADALVAYFDALIVGADPRDVEEHLLHVASQQGLQDLARRMVKKVQLLDVEKSNAIDRRPHSKAVISLCYLFLNREPTISERADWMCRYDSVRALANHLIEMSECKHHNRDLLRFIADIKSAQV